MDTQSSNVFRPLPFLGNPHVQTVLAHLTNWARDRVPPATFLVPLSDGDSLAIHETLSDSWQPDDPCVLLVHGLGGCSRSAYMRRCSNRLSAAGLRVYRIDMRGAGASMPHGRRLYNAACSDDLREALAWIHERNLGSPLFLAGFSLGGNIVLKLAGEAADDPVPGLAGVATLAAPLDLVDCSKLIKDYPLYDRFYIRNLTNQLAAHARIFPEHRHPDWPAKLTLEQFDELYTAPRGGFSSILEYYEQASSLPLVPKIEVPAFLLTSRDDPFIGWKPYADLPANDNLEVHIASHGGHLGFLGRDGLGGIRWAETQIVDWILRQATCSAPVFAGQ